MVTAIQSFKSDQWIEGYRKAIQRDGGVWHHPQTHALAQRIMTRMIPHTHRENLPWEITLLDSNNGSAYAMAGGKLALFRGRVKRLERISELQRGLSTNHSNPKIRELREKQSQALSSYGNLSLEDIYAATISHEMAHIALGHLEFGFSLKEAGLFIGGALPLIPLTPLFGWLAESISCLLFAQGSIAALNCAVFLGGAFGGILGMTFGLLPSFIVSRSREYDADRLGMQIMAQAGYNPEAALCVRHADHIRDELNEENSWLQWLSSWFSTHPSNLERLSANKITLANLNIH